jgi:hypothetical protein
MMSNALADMYHTCRWCKWYQGGKCINTAFTAGSDDVLGVYEVAESGRLSEAIQETLNSASLETLERELRGRLADYKLSGKKIEELVQAFYDGMEMLVEREFTPKLDEVISKLYQDHAGTVEPEGVEIVDPHTFYCREFW